jgi:hypothetical protein
MRARIRGDELAGLVGQIKQDGARLEHRNRLAAVGRRMIDDRRDAVVGRDGQKVCLELLAFADVDRNDLVFQSRFLEENRDLVAIRRSPVKHVNHDKPFW